MSVWSWGIKARAITVLLGCCVAVAAMSKPVEVKMVLRELLNQRYERELVNYPFTAPKGACVADSIQVTGPQGPVAAQLTQVEYWDAQTKDVKSARLQFVVDELQPLAANTYTISYDAQAAPPDITDLLVMAEKDQVDIITTGVSVRLLLGAMTYPRPVPAAQVPGPLLGMRVQNGAWTGGSALSGDAQVASWSATLTENGPLLAQVVYTCQFADGGTLTATARVIAGDNTVRWQTAVSRDTAASLIFRLPAAHGMRQVLCPKGYGQWAKDDRTLPITPGTEPFCYLSPDTSIANAFPECPSHIVLKGDSELQLHTQDAAVWAEVIEPFTYGGASRWELATVGTMWNNWKRNRIAVSYAGGTLTLNAPLVKGGRKWTVSAGDPTVSERLNRIKDMVLDWPADKAVIYPRLYVGRQEIFDVWQRAAVDAKLKQTLNGSHYAAAALQTLMKPVEAISPAEREKVVGNLREKLGSLGNYDVMRHAIGVTSLYDALYDSPLLTAQERVLFRAQMAYLGYLMADPQCWNPERGYNSGNPNMSASYILSLGVIACVLPDHPMAKTWAAYATGWMDTWLNKELGPNGEWMSEGSHYSYVSLEPFITYAIAAKRAGYHDFSNDARFKKMLLYYAKYNTPRDPRRDQQRTIATFGRGTSGDRLAVFGVAAPFFKETDPALSRTLQWMWAENGYPIFMDDSRLGGFEPYYQDRRLPVEAPQWASELFPTLGGLFRHGFNTPNESYLNILAAVDSQHNLDIWTPGVGGIPQWFGRGKPISECFSFEIGYNERHELTRDGVRLARNWGDPDDPKGPFGHYTKTDFGGCAILPGVDYITSRFTNLRVDDRDWFPAVIPPAFPKVRAATGDTLTWTRQLLFMKDANPAGPAYVVLRDTTAGGQPTVWQFWTLSEKLGTPEQVADPNFLADAPGQKLVDAHELVMSDRYTAIGQQGVDVEYFIASPDASPRHTLRYGGTWTGNRVPNYQDLLHLQLPDDGAYYVAIYPRPRVEAAPSFTTLANGKIIRVAGNFGTDFTFLAATETTAAAEAAEFRGTAGAIQQRANGRLLTLGAAGEVRCDGIVLAAPAPAALWVTPESITLTLPADQTGTTVTIIAPAGCKLKSQAGVTLDTNNDRYTLTVAKGVTTVVLTRK